MSNIEIFQKYFENIKLHSSASVEERITIWEDIYKNINRCIPKKLYRFRSYTSFYVDAFINNKISNTNPSMFSDKYDSVYYLDKLKITNFIKRVVKQTQADIIKNTTPNHHILSKENVFDSVFDKMTQMIDDSKLFFRHYNHIKISSFSENIESKYMWDAYASGYTGFALEYNFSNFHDIYDRNSILLHKISMMRLMS